MPAAVVPAAVINRGAAGFTLPQVIVDAGSDAAARFLEFFAGRIANERTRAALREGGGQFLAWCEARGLGLDAVSPLHAAAYIRTHPDRSRPSSSTWPRSTTTSSRRESASDGPRAALGRTAAAGWCGPRCGRVARPRRSGAARPRPAGGRACNGRREQRAPWAIRGRMPGRSGRSPLWRTTQADKVARGRAWTASPGRGSADELMS